MKETFINAIIETEGGYVNDPSDSGGETKYGITVETARLNGYKGDMIKLPQEVAFAIYKNQYWDSIKGNHLLSISPKVTFEVMDTSVNMGPTKAIVFLQRALNVFNNRAELYSDLAVDGRVGAKTLTALKQYLRVREESTLVKTLNCLQGAFYVELAERREKDERFIRGWIDNRVELK